ncbi:MAG: hypothetical protein AAGA42_10725 [Actinomycetota bacterium]
MILGRDLRYVFVQVPQTGSTAVGSWLCDHYGGEPVLEKHATIIEARHRLGRELDGCVVIVSIRDTYDQLISSYYKAHHGYHNASAGFRALRHDRSRWVSEHDASLPEFVDRFARRILAPVHALSLRRADIVLRRESLGADVAELGHVLGDARPPVLPRRNATRRPTVVLEHALSADQMHRVERLHRPFRYEFGYTEVPPSATDRAAYETLLHLKHAERRLARWLKGS